MTYPRQWGLAFSSIRLATFLSIVVTLILIAPIAFASPPDPSWIAGIYDGADGDDVVALVYETAGVEAASLGSLVPLLRAAYLSLARGPGGIRGFALQQFIRGPPFPRALVISNAPPRLHHRARFHAHLVLRSVTLPSDPARMRIAFVPKGDVPTPPRV